MEHTKEELVIAWLTKRGGYVELVNYPSKRYRVFRNSGKGPLAFVGKHGALRFGLTIKQTTSYPVNFSKLRVVMAN